ncbi:tetratricopeptide repeat protein [Photobacterium minamisatsumaniensis]|uniref:tetratricopeptide repeat protein n=1 Tax=Photobacterium minamisatsumaniensis TaxID=2910233 RepID=UPI003D0EF627
MSELNKKLNALSQQQEQGAVKAAVLKPAPIKPIVKSYSAYWAMLAVAGLAFAGSIGWWLGAGNHQPDETVSPVLQESELQESEQTTVFAVEPTGKIVPVISEDVATIDVTAANHMTTAPEPADKLVTTTQVEVLKPAVKPVVKTPVVVHSEPVNPPVKVVKSNVIEKKAIKAPTAVTAISSPTVKVKEPVLPDHQSEVVLANEEADSAIQPDGLMIESIELDAEQLANVEYSKAEKALKDGDIIKAIRYLEAAVKYQPTWVTARQKLSALYYGRGENRRALATLQQGLVHDAQQPDLRLTMAKLLVNESQSQAALNVLAEMPAEVHGDYLAMRGALAQRLKNNVLAMSSYQALVKKEPYDGRWWMGLGIAFERSDANEKAQSAYLQALQMGRISQQSQQFIQQRLTILENREG